MPVTPGGSTFGTHDPYSNASFEEHMGGPPRLGLPDLPNLPAWMQDWLPGAETIRPWIVDILGVPSWESAGAVRASEHGTGVYDTVSPGVPEVVSYEGDTGVQHTPDESPQWLPSWPDEWKKGSGGWNDDDWVYPTQNDTGDVGVAIDWGGVVSGVIDVIQGQTPGYGFTTPGQFPVPVQPLPGAAPPMIPPSGGGLCPPSGSCGGPRYLTYDCKTGAMSLRRRRRRRRLLTEGDKQDLGVIVAMFGKGAAAQIALAAAVKR